MNLRRCLATATIGVSLSATLWATPAGAATSFEMVGFAGGSIVHALNGTVTSALTAASSVDGTTMQVDTNATASLVVANLISSGSVQTSTASFRVPGGVEVLSHARLTGFNMLGGAIKADALDTTTTAVYSSGVAASDSQTRFVGLHIAGHTMPANIPNNFVVNIPNIAEVILNATAAVSTSNGISREGVAIEAVLLRPRGTNETGAKLDVNPTYAAVQSQASGSAPALGGNAYGTAIYAAVGQLVDVKSDPTAPISMPPGGTSGVTNYNTLAAGNLAPLLQIGAITTSAKGTKTATALDSRLTTQIAGIKLFNGAITAGAITVSAHAHGVISNGQDIDATATGSATLVNLFIAGRSIALDVAPNTVINVLNLGRVTINQQISTPNGIRVRALDIVLAKAQAGLPVGAELQVATATAFQG